MHAVAALLFPSLAATAAELLGSPAALLAIALGLVLVIAVHQVHGSDLDLWALPARGRASALTECARQAAFLRLRDPRAAGRRQPRAPSAAVPAA
ncbi:DUF6412 domain-containing protein [Amycolatopsis sp. YIM 10]|uniref:DUF6412 domain-containing protein n=1 Tax=Amycolatopsis sp. YIM 10 TaxID=2653857 RepID=UPI0012905E24|nr:DUF6412 domain-containing protein [Amycolatopsis sp. YIM 10]QFU93757.1 hypothetical protein YIM_43110 [Amycolatopsis sp. YIM 10]